MNHDKDEDDDDADLFSREMANVRPLKKTVIPIVPPRPRAMPVQNTVQHEHESSYPLEDIQTDFGLRSMVATEFSRNGISASIMRKLKKGGFRIEAELDLHGLNTSQAKQSLVSFLSDCMLMNYRCIAIIHGQGHRSKNNIAVLKLNTAHWLGQIPQVLAYCQAPINAGGAGAVYVLLKKS